MSINLNNVLTIAQQHHQNVLQLNAQSTASNVRQTVVSLSVFIIEHIGNLTTMGINPEVSMLCMRVLNAIGKLQQSLPSTSTISQPQPRPRPMSPEPKSPTVQEDFVDVPPLSPKAVSTPMSSISQFDVQVLSALQEKVKKFVQNLDPSAQCTSFSDFKDIDQHNMDDYLCSIARARSKGEDIEGALAVAFATTDSMQDNEHALGVAKTAAELAKSLFLNQVKQGLLERKGHDIQAEIADLETTTAVNAVAHDTLSSAANICKEIAAQPSFGASWHVQHYSQLCVLYKHGLTKVSELLTQASATLVSTTASTVTSSTAQEPSTNSSAVSAISPTPAPSQPQPTDLAEWESESFVDASGLEIKNPSK